MFMSFSSVQGRSYELIPCGEQDALLTGVSIKTSAKGNQYINWEFTVQGGVHNGRKVWASNTLETAEQAFFAKQTMEALDPKRDIPDFTCKLEFERFLKGYVQSEVTVLIGQNEYQGRTTNRVEEVYPLEESEDEPQARTRTCDPAFADQVPF
jgi:hypothetical protein